MIGRVIQWAACLSHPSRALLCTTLFTLTGFNLPAATYTDLVLNDKPAAYWSLQDTNPSLIKNLTSQSDHPQLEGQVNGKLDLQYPGQPTANFPGFDASQKAVHFSGPNQYISIKDPGEESLLDITLDESLTLEAWVSLDQIQNGQQIYVVGKGRTGRKDVPAHNQNYALRLRGQSGQGCLSFLFRNARNRSDISEDWHRWTSKKGILAGSGWHHIAISYTFGHSKSIRGYVDGKPVPGTWDMGGATDDGPVVDNDEIWIGSALKAQAGSTFSGSINHVALHRKVLSPEKIKKRFLYVPSSPKIDQENLPAEFVQVEIFENVGPQAAWIQGLGEGDPVEVYHEPAFCFAELPRKYSNRGVRTDRSNPFLIRAAALIQWPQGEHQLLLRSLQGARLFVDNELVAVTPFIHGSGDGHGAVAEPPTDHPSGLRYARMGHQDRAVVIQTTGQSQLVVLEAFVGGKNHRRDLGELSVSHSFQGGLYHLLSPGATSWPHTDAGWKEYAAAQSQRLIEANQKRRQSLVVSDKKYWTQRHEKARSFLDAWPRVTVPKVSSQIPVHNEIDRFIGAKVEQAKVTPTNLTDDWAFLRRLALDVVGKGPTGQQIQTFRKDHDPGRRARAIDRFLNNPGWADNWVGYWQDVLAENPGILKPTLNNTGPFRYWIHESFLDNKPMDQFATELIRMEGSVYHGGPAGFKLATQNDVPMADRAQIISQAFLAMNLTCARCHDAPYHDFKQEDLFSLAAMLKQEPQIVPASSSIPANADIKVGRLVNVTLKPGEKVAPAWPFSAILNPVPGTANSSPESGWLNNHQGELNSREQLAAMVTDPRNQRFARVLVNRIWKRYLGWGLIEPVDDWDLAEASHPELLTWLARQLVGHDYNLKHVARLILNSHTYQRQTSELIQASEEPADRLFAAPARRRMTAEQLVDSLFQAVGKEMRAELLTLDNDARRPAKSFLNLGYPSRSWEFVSLSNDRDRPALSLPRTQEIVDVLAMFGWRESRQNPRSERDHAPNILQPAVLANGALGNGRVTRLSDHCAITDLCLEQIPLPQMIQKVYWRVLARPASQKEITLFQDYLNPGFAERISASIPTPSPKPFDKSLLLSWSNHLNPTATEIKMVTEELARLGDPPTDRLNPDWRERMEDMVWVLVNSPEFVFIP